MQDNLEKFVRKNKNELDSELPGEKVWHNIRPKIKREKQSALLPYIKIAAVLVIGIGIGYYFVSNQRQPAPRHIGHKNEIDNTLAYLAPEFTALTSDLQDVLSMEMDKIRKEAILNGDTGYFAIYVRQLKELDNRNELYKKQLSQYGYNENILQEMIQYYELKLEVLKKLHYEIAKVNNHTKKYQYETKPVYLQL